MGALWVWLGLALSACDAPPTEQLTFERQWELFAIFDQGEALHVALSQGNRGLQKGEGRLQWSHVPLRGSGTTLAEVYAASTVTIDSASNRWRAGSNDWETTEDGAHIQIRGTSGIDARFILERFADPIESMLLESSDRQWSVELSDPHARIAGAWNVAGAASIGSGRAVSLRSTSVGFRQRDPDDLSIHVMASEASLSIVRSDGSTIAWLTEGGLSHQIDDLIVETDGPVVTIRSEGQSLSVALICRRPPLLGVGQGDLIAPERWLSETVLGPLERSLWSTQTELVVGQRRLPARAVILDGYGVERAHRLVRRRNR
jgi:hypothetical protein